MDESVRFDAVPVQDCETKTLIFRCSRPASMRLTINGEDFGVHCQGHLDWIVRETTGSRQ